MLGPNDTVLWTATVLDAPLPEKVAAAAAAGFDAVSMRFADIVDARSAGSSDADIRALVADHGLQVHAAETLVGWVPAGRQIPVGGGMTQMHVDPRAAIEAAVAVGAPSLSVGELTGTPVAHDLACELFAALCDDAAEFGLVVHLEFLSWGAVPNLATAWDIVRATDRPNAGLLIDSFHFFRSGSELALLREVPGERITAVQLNDARRDPVPDPRVDSHDDRLLPGEGVIDLVGLIRTLDGIGSTAPFGVEIASAELRGQPAARVAADSLQALRNVLRAARVDAPA
jgi:sugar phosphate isomerase/epimerase